MNFTELGLRPELVRAVADEGYETPTPIQAQAIPVALRGEDVLGCAQTGTGKTASFVLPVLQRLADGPRGKVRALVVTPTRELAIQIGERANAYGRHLQLRSTTIYGGVGIGPQIDKLRRGIEIVIATPGRLLDHVKQRTVNLGSVEILVLDEADRMLDMGFLPDVKRILALLPKQRQNLFFSATMPNEIQDLINRTMNKPTVIEVVRRATPAEAVKQVVHPVGGDVKRELIAKLLQEREMTSVLVFTRTKARADRLAKYLDQMAGRKVAAIHGNKSQNARTRALDGFKSGKIDTLVATDIAARGIDVEGISHVINFDLPNVPEDYVHRIGRTARAGASGIAISLVAFEENGYLRSIEKLIGATIPKVAVDGFATPTHAAPAAPKQPRGPRQQRPARPSAPSTRGAYRTGSLPSSRPPARGERPLGDRANAGSTHPSSARPARPGASAPGRVRSEPSRPAGRGRRRA